jgi:hypothetical protein
MAKKSRPRKIFPYYKVQIVSPRQLCWIDARKKAFDSLDEAKGFIGATLTQKTWRILEVEAHGRRVIEEHELPP